MNKLATFLVITILTVSSFDLLSQNNKLGNHLIKNYEREVYNAAAQNWAIVQDKRGVIYVGNAGQILEYDGTNWRKINNTNNSYVRSLAVDEQGTIYAGSSREFGYLKPNKKGELEYVELSSEIDSSFKEVWNTYVYKDTVYFCSPDMVFKYYRDSLLKIIPYTKDHFLDFMVDGVLYSGHYSDGLLKLKNNKPVLVQGGEFYQKKDIFSILPFKEDKLLITVSREGLYLYDKKTGKSVSISTLGSQFDELNEYLKQVQVYNGTILSSGDLAFGSLDDGLVIADGKTGAIKYHYSDKNGLIDPTIIDVYEGQDQNLWLGLNNGIAHIEYNTPFKHFDKNAGIQGIPFDIVRYQGDIFLGTTSGLYKQTFDEEGYPHFEKIPGIENQVRSLIIFKSPDNKEILLAGTHVGVFEVSKEGRVKKLRQGDRFYKTDVIKQSEYHKDRLYVGYYHGLALFKYENGRWYDKGSLRDSIAPEFDVGISSLVEEDPSIVWASTNLNGVYKINKLQEVTSYDTTKCLPTMSTNLVHKFNDRIIFLTKRGFYFYDKEKDKLSPDSIFNGRYLNLPVRRFFHLGNSFSFVVFEKEGIEQMEMVERTNDTIRITEKPFLRLKGEEYQGYFDDTGSTIWFTTYQGIYNYDPTIDKSYDPDFNSLIRIVALGNDSVLFEGTYYDDTTNYSVSLKQPGLLTHELDYKHNEISFRYSAAFYEKEEEVEYSYKLLGYDEDWSPWSKKDDKGYTNLNEGKYTFLVKARNIYEMESRPAEYSFTILPPWYRTYWAYFLYVIAAVSLVILIVRWYTRRLEKEKIRLEKIVQERTKEVVEQKDQIEKQRDEIAKKNQDITDSIEYASKIQNAVLPAEEVTKNILPDHFVFFRPRDIVSGDFYWIDQKDGLLIVIAADCTGHGVPGAFMSMLGVSLLNEIVNKHETTQANEILNELRDEVKRTLRQTGKEGEAKDGMDIALTVVDLNNMKMQFAGAYNPLYFFRDGELYQYKADRMPIGIYIREKPTFTNHEIDLKKGDTFYIFSDGFQDQFGGKEGRKFKARRLKDLLAKIQDRSMEDQKEIIVQTFEEWKGGREQLDDVILIGVRV